MRVTILPLVLAGAGLIQFAAASPIRVVVVSGHTDASSFTKIQLSNDEPFGAKVIRPDVVPTIHMPMMQQGAAGHGHLCEKFKNKALEISNKFRQTFGLPLIEKPPVTMNAVPIYRPLAPVPIPQGEVKILPFVGTPPIPIFAPAELPPIHHPHHAVDARPGQRMRHHRPGGCHRSFVHRLHRALMVLGPWEGRAVAFVLGCGIGVLLRMFWVMAIVIARSLRSRGSSEDDEVEHILVFERDAEDIFVAPPEYTDEKVALVAVDQKVDTSA